MHLEQQYSNVENGFSTASISVGKWMVHSSTHLISPAFLSSCYGVAMARPQHKDELIAAANTQCESLGKLLESISP